MKRSVFATTRHVERSKACSRNCPARGQNGIKLPAMGSLARLLCPHRQRDLTLVCTFSCILLTLAFITTTYPSPIPNPNLHLPFSRTTNTRHRRHLAHQTLNGRFDRRRHQHISPTLFQSRYPITIHPQSIPGPRYPHHPLSPSATMQR